MKNPLKVLKKGHFLKVVHISTMTTTTIVFKLLKKKLEEVKKERNF